MYLLVLFCLVARTEIEAQEQYRVYLPFVSCDRGDCYMGIWSIVVPEATTNYTLNPSGEIAGNFAAVGGGTMTRVTTTQWIGVYSYRIQTAANNEGGTLTLQALSNAIHYVTVRVAGTLPADWDWSLDNATYTTPARIKAYDTDWTLYGLEFPAAQANGSTTLYIRQNGAGAGDFNVDGIQVEQKDDYWTTYCDGTQDGCEWNGAVHASTSTRSALSRAGGRVRELTDYYFEVSRMDGPGMPPQELGLQQYAILPGGEMTSVREGSLPFTLTGAITDTVGVGFTELADVHAAREALIALLRPNAYPYVDGDPQPVRFRYTGAATEKELAAHYEAGLELRINGEFPCWERVAFRFIADDPFWYEIGNSATVLDSNDTATMRYVAGRLRATGQWDDLGLTNNPTANGTIYTILYASDGYVYVGGNFTGMNNVAGRDYVAAYNPQTDIWSTVGGASDFNAVVYSLIEGPDGTIYAGGGFTNVAGDANADYVAQWNGAAWSAVSGGGVTTVLDLAFDNDGLLWIVGSFQNWNAIGNADRVVTWDGAAYAAPAVGANATVEVVTTHPNGDVYIGGQFTTIGGISPNLIARWDGTAWNTVADDTIDLGFVHGLSISNTGIVYAGGAFLNASGNTLCDRIAFTRGQIWEPMSEGANNTVFEIGVGPNGDVYASGLFTDIGGISGADRLARWNGTTWAQEDVTLPGAVTVRSFAFGPRDPVIGDNYDLYEGFDTTGTAYFAGDATLTNAGSAEAYPILKFTRSGGTSATLVSVRNETLGLELLLDYGLQDGETLTITLMPESKAIVSSFYGPIPGAILPNSDIGTWRLGLGANLVTCYVSEAGAPTVTATAEWRTAWAGCDD